MKNVTITLPEDVARWARVWAAERESSLSKAIADLLSERMNADSEYVKAMD